jgi:hypothetical protein
MSLSDMSFLLFFFAMALLNLLVALEDGAAGAQSHFYCGSFVFFNAAMFPHTTSIWLSIITMVPARAVSTHGVSLQTLDLQQYAHGRCHYICSQHLLLQHLWPTPDTTPTAAATTPMADTKQHTTATRPTPSTQPQPHAQLSPSHMQLTPI